MNIAVLVFFLHNIVATFLLGHAFFSKKDRLFRIFGVSLLLDAAAFVVWTAAVVMKPANLEYFVTVGALFFIASLVTLIPVAVQHVKAQTRQALIVLGVLLGIGLFYVRTFVYPSQPSFSSEGLFFFNIRPMVQLIYIAGLIIAAVPAIDFVAAKFKHPYNSLVRYGFLTEVVGGIILITNNDPMVLYVMGWVMGIMYFLLWTILLFNRKAWNS